MSGVIEGVIWGVSLVVCDGYARAGELNNMTSSVLGRLFWWNENEASDVALCLMRSRKIQSHSRNQRLRRLRTWRVSGLFLTRAGVHHMTGDCCKVHQVPTKAAFQRRRTEMTGWIGAGKNVLVLRLRVRFGELLLRVLSSRGSGT